MRCRVRRGPGSSARGVSRGSSHHRRAANNSKKAAASCLRCSFAFRQFGMTVMLGAFVTLGITPGRRWPSPRPGPRLGGFRWTVIRALVLANMLSVLCFLYVSEAMCLARVGDCRVGGDVPLRVVLCADRHLYSARGTGRPSSCCSAFGLLGIALKHHELAARAIRDRAGCSHTRRNRPAPVPHDWGRRSCCRPLTLVLIAWCSPACGRACALPPLARGTRARSGPAGGVRRRRSRCVALAVALPPIGAVLVLPALIAGLGAVLALACAWPWCGTGPLPASAG